MDEYRIILKTCYGISEVSNMPVVKQNNISIVSTYQLNMQNISCTPNTFIDKFPSHQIDNYIEYNSALSNHE